MDVNEIAKSVPKWRDARNGVKLYGNGSSLSQVLVLFIALVEWRVDLVNWAEKAKAASASAHAVFNLVREVCCAIVGISYTGVLIYANMQVIMLTYFWAHGMDFASTLQNIMTGPVCWLLLVECFRASPTWCKIKEAFNKLIESRYDVVTTALRCEIREAITESMTEIMSHISDKFGNGIQICGRFNTYNFSTMASLICNVFAFFGLYNVEKIVRLATSIAVFLIGGSAQALASDARDGVASILTWLQNNNPISIIGRTFGRMFFGRSDTVGEDGTNTWETLNNPWLNRMRQMDGTRYGLGFVNSNWHKIERGAKFAFFALVAGLASKAVYDTLESSVDIAKKRSQALKDIKAEGKERREAAKTIIDNANFKLWLNTIKAGALGAIQGAAVAGLTLCSTIKRHVRIRGRDGKAVWDIYNTEDGYVFKQRGTDGVWRVDADNKNAFYNFLDDNDIDAADYYTATEYDDNDSYTYESESEDEWEGKHARRKRYAKEEANEGADGLGDLSSFKKSSKTKTVLAMSVPKGAEMKSVETLVVRRTGGGYVNGIITRNSIVFPRHIVDGNMTTSCEPVDMEIYLEGSMLTDEPFLTISKDIIKLDDKQPDIAYVEIGAAVRGRSDASAKISALSKMKIKDSVHAATSDNVAGAAITTAPLRLENGRWQRYTHATTIVSQHKRTLDTNHGQFEVHMVEANIDTQPGDCGTPVLVKRSVDHTMRVSGVLMYKRSGDSPNMYISSANSLAAVAKN